MKLYSEVQMLVAQGASIQSIHTKMNQVYNYPSEEHPCWSLLAVYAVHYNHPGANSFYLHALPFQSSRVATRFDASLTAVTENKLQYVSAFVKDVAAISYCYDHKLGVKVYGIMNNDDTISDSQISPLDIILCSDEADTLVLFVTKMKPWETDSLIKICELYNAEKGRRALQKLKRVSEVDAEEMLTSLLNYANYFGTASSDLNDHFILHLNCFLRKNLGTAAGSNHLTCKEVALVKRAVNNGTCVLDRDLVARVLLDSLVFILHAKAQNGSSVPAKAIEFLVYSSHSLVPFVHDDDEDDADEDDEDDDEELDLEEEEVWKNKMKKMMTKVSMKMMVMTMTATMTMMMTMKTSPMKTRTMKIRTMNTKVFLMMKVIIMIEAVKYFCS